MKPAEKKMKPAQNNQNKNNQNKNNQKPSSRNQQTRGQEPDKQGEAPAHEFEYDTTHTQPYEKGKDTCA